MNEPVITFLGGSPTVEEIAAVVTALLARSGSQPAQPEPQQSSWAAYWRSVGAPIQPGPGKWQAAVRGW
ncbi:hypothetical protein GCM10011575_41220 [Microlunatus endophyticus]|uniref:Acyl-CoA carboxylase epsilon subunit n=1 Tax=Microlunatus endophyticus TaxID=1716077 RepID=A0A917SHL8_9ACTN|nr:acyl-CoA carboxylase subunit epsilon [Microlunatus endophyticus]GGL78650.1 hypothetical protein GCM10011575_41220 [Microlunatus endophyticus]